MPHELTIDLLCIFSWAHNTAMAEANFLAWTTGTAAGLILATVVGTRFRGSSSTGDRT